MAYANVPNVVFEMDVSCAESVVSKYKKIILTVFSCFLVAAVSCLIFNAISFNLYSPFFSFVLFATIGCIFLRGNARVFYLLSFFVYVVFGHLLAWSFYRDHTNFFIGGGDDQLFYDLALSFAREGFDVLDPHYIGLSSKGYVHILASYVSVLDFLGFKGKSYFFDLLFINNALGAFTISAVYGLVRNRLNVKLKLRFCLFLVFFPFVLYYSSTLLRDVCVMISLSTVACLIASNLKSYLKGMLIALVIMILATIRPASALFVLTLPVSFVLLSIKSFFWRSSIAIGILAGAIILYVQFSSLYGVQIDASNEMYNNLVEQEASGDSIGAKLRASKNPVLVVANTIYTLYSPIPPPIFKDISFRNGVLSIGSFLWYFLLPAYFFSVWWNYKKQNINRFDLMMKSFSITFISSLIIISFTSGDTRHLLFLYPFVLLGVFQYINQKKQAYVNFLAIYSLFAIIVVGGYIALKIYI